MLANLLFAPAAWAQFDIQITINNPGQFGAAELDILNAAIPLAEQLWESRIVGYQADLPPVLPITLNATTTGLAEAAVTSTTVADGFVISTGGFININANAIADFASFEAFSLPGSPTVNVIDELIAHEIGHVLGVGPLWVANGVYVNGTGQYTGEFGVATYQQEFNQTTDFVPVELAGPSASQNVHWDQLFRSSPEEGNPADPFSLSPELGIVDGEGRDLGFELLTAAIDPDFGEPFLGEFTVQSLRDIGFVVTPPSFVVPEPSGVLLALVGVAALCARRR